jgi:hypothetical protein
MSKFSLDYNQLNNRLNTRLIRLADVKDKIEKVAFDVVRFRDSDSASNLWQIQGQGDEQYIVALYPEEVEKLKLSSWEVSLSKLANTVSFFYKGEPVVKLAASELGVVGQDQLEKTVKSLPRQLETNKKLASALLKKLPATAVEDLLRKYPELA